MKKIRVRITSNAKTTEEIRKDADGTWKIKVSAPAREGAANTELIRYLAVALDVSKSEIHILNGHVSKHKTIGIPDHVSLEDIDY